jgi:hypothetical protein
MTPQYYFYMDIAPDAKPIVTVLFYVIVMQFSPHYPDCLGGQLSLVIECGEKGLTDPTGSN